MDPYSLATLSSDDDEPMDEPATSEDYAPPTQKPKKPATKKQPAAKSKPAAKATKAPKELKVKGAGVKKAPKAAAKPKGPKVWPWEAFVSPDHAEAPPALFDSTDDLDAALDTLAEAGNEELSEAVATYREYMDDRGEDEDPLACFVQGGVRSTPFQVAARAIVSRMRGVKGSNTMWNRIVDAMPAGTGVHPDGVLKIKASALEDMIGNQRSGQVHAVAQAFADEGFGEDGTGADDAAFKALAAMPEGELMDKKSWIHSAKGIGESTLYTILVRALGRADVLPFADGLLTKFLQKHKLFNEDDSDGKLDGNAEAKRLAAKTISEATEMWKPNRGVAVKLIWHQSESAEGVQFW